MATYFARQTDLCYVTAVDGRLVSFHQYLRYWDKRDTVAFRIPSAAIYARCHIASINFSEAGLFEHAGSAGQLENGQE